MKTTIVLLGLTLLTSCANLSNNWKMITRDPQSVYEFIEYIPLLNERVRSEEYLNPRSCEGFIKKYTSYVYEKDSQYYFPKNESEKEYFLEKGDESLKGLFHLRLGLRDFIKNNQGELSSVCLTSIRSAIRYTRFAEDSLAEWLFFNSSKYQAPPKLHFQGGLPHTIVNPSFENISFKSGDLLLMRGQSFVSAMIARIGDEDAQFSHLGMIGEDATGKLYVVEALIETGVIYTPLEEFIKKEETRLVLLRNTDQDLAKKAGQEIFKFAYGVKSKNGVIPYDFAMEDDDHSQLFCSEVIRYAYKLASNNSYQVPLFKTSFSKLIDSDFMHAMGVTAKETFAPADIELDHRFEVVAEFRTIKNLRKVRMQDVILTSIYHWIEYDGYEFKFNLSSKLKSNAAWIARKLGFAKEKMQKHMKASTLETIIKFQSLTKPLEDHLFAVEKDYFDTFGHSLTFKDMLRINEDFRLQDCEAYKINSEKSFEEGFIPLDIKMHNEFRASKKSGCN